MQQRPPARQAFQPAIADRSPRPSAARARRILFVNGDADLREVVKRVLEREDYEVSTAAHSGHAVLLGRTNQFDAIVTELSGPDMSGPTLVERLRRHCPTMAAVYFANPGTPEGIEHVLVRPFTRDDLLDRLVIALSSRIA